MPRYGTEVAPQLSAPNHQHFFGARLDSRWTERTTRSRRSIPGACRPARKTRHGNAFFAEATPLLNETARPAKHQPALVAVLAGREPSRKNGLGRPVAYRLCPGENVLPFAQPGAAVLERAGFLTSNLWVTPYRSRGTIPGRRVSQPEPRRRRPAEVDQGQSRDRRTRPRRLVQLRPDSYSPASRTGP